MRAGRAVVALAAVALLAACADDDSSTATTATTAPATTATTVATCVADPSATTGTQERVELTGGPRDGWYLRYVPAVDVDGPRALVVDLHGLAEGAEIHTRMSDFAGLADSEGFVVASPQGTGAIPFWNHLERPAGPPDVAFVAAVIDDVEADLCTDPDRVYLAGLSNGAMMSSTVGCELADRVAAIGPVAGVRFPDGCDPARPVPVLAVHGTDDRLVRYDGGPPDIGDFDAVPVDAAVAENFAGQVFQPVPEAMAGWAEAGGCDAEAVEERVADDVTRLRWEGCAGGADVELLRVEGGGHAWPGSDLSAAVERIVGRTTMSIDATAELWAFFEAHPLPDGGG